MNILQKQITKNTRPHELHVHDNKPKNTSRKNKKVRSAIKNLKRNTPNNLQCTQVDQKTLDQFEHLVQTKRNLISKKSGQGGYQEDELTLREIVEFLSPVLDENGETISIGTDEHGEEHFKLVNLQKMQLEKI